MARKVRSDILVGNLEKRLGLEPGSIRNPDGTDARSNKKLATLRKEFSQVKGNKLKTNPAISKKAIEKATKAVKALAGSEWPKLSDLTTTKRVNNAKKKTILKKPSKQRIKSDVKTVLKPIVEAVTNKKSLEAYKPLVKKAPKTAGKK